MSDTPETDSFTHSVDETPFYEWVYAGQAMRLERERDEARMGMDQAVAKLELAEAKALIMEASLKWIAGRYCHEQTTAHLALVAYEMSSEARWTLQEMEQKEEA